MEHFTQAAGNFVKYRHCSAKLVFVSRHTHLSSLTKHLKAKHSEVLRKPDEEPVSKVSRIGDYYTPPHATFPALPSIDRQAIAACSSNHAPGRGSSFSMGVLCEVCGPAQAVRAGDQSCARLAFESVRSVFSFLNITKQ